MRTWDIFARLQGELAYGSGVASDEPANDTNAIVLEYFRALNLDRPLVYSLVIGPGGAAEVRALAPSLPQPVMVMTSHTPEVDALRAAMPAEAGRIELGDIHDMSYQSGAFDVVFAANVLEHTLAPYIALLECRRVMREGGIAYFVIPSFAGSGGGKGPYHLHCLDPNVWKELLWKCGLTVSGVAEQRGSVDPETVYTHYRCVACTPPHPHDRVLADLVEFRRTH